MAGYDENDVNRLLVESKFWATLSKGQASSYFNLLDQSSPAVLLFIAPNGRIETLWVEIVRQITEENQEQSLRPWVLQMIGEARWLPEPKSAWRWSVGSDCLIAWLTRLATLVSP